MAKKKLVIFPFNGNGLEALDCINYDKYEFVGFIDDDQTKSSEAFVIHRRSILRQYKELLILAVPGSPASFRQRKTVIESLEVNDHSRFVSVVHPNAHVGPRVQIGHNCLIMAGVVLTSNAQLGNHICILPNSVLHHDVVIGSYTLIGSNVVIAGRTEIGENCYIGSGSNIINGIRIGSGALIGLGSNIIRPVPKYAKMAGNPARNLNISSIEKV